MINSFLNNPFSFLIFLLVLLATIAVHEYAHAKVADHLGDPTARLMGRTTLNPLAHIDLFGLIFLLFFGFGWGKPVPFDPFNLKNPKRDAAIISFAGPLSNFIIAIASSFLMKLLIFLQLPVVTLIGLSLLSPLIYLNLILGIFNLVPVAPLDGFKVVGGLLPEKKAREWYQLEKYGIFFLLALLLPVVGGRSMIETFIFPVIGFFTQLLLPH